MLQEMLVRGPTASGPMLASGDGVGRMQASGDGVGRMLASGDGVGADAGV